MRTVLQRHTQDVPPDRRLSVWRDWVHESVVEMDFVPIGREPFSCAIEICPLAATAPHRAIGSPQRVTRGTAEIARSGKEAMYLISQPTVPWRLQHAGQDHLLQPGQSVLIDATQPYVFEFNCGLNDLSVEIAPDWIARWLPDPVRWIGVPLDIHSPWGRALRAMKEALVPDQIAATSVPCALLEDQLGVLLVLATGAGELTHRRPTLVARCIEAIRAQLTSPSLVAADIAHQVGVSVRSLHRAFAADGCTFAGTLMRLRADEAARMLLAPRFHNLSIAEIARRSGFADASHFSRMFRQLRGTSPARFRSAQTPHRRNFCATDLPVQPNDAETRNDQA